MRAISLFAVAGVLAFVELGASGQGVVPPPRPVDMTAASMDPEPARMNQIFADLRDGHAPAALAQTTELLRSFPDSVVLNCASGEAAVVSNDRLSVHLALERLKQLAPGQECVARLELQYGRMTNPALREQVISLVKAGNLDGARQLVVSAHLAPSEDLVIQHYLDRAQTHFTNSLIRLQQLTHVDPASADRAAALQRETMAAAQEYAATRQAAQAYLFDPVATSSCSPQNESDVFARRGFNFSEFFAISRDLVREFPSNPDVQQIRFMALLLRSSKNLPQGPNDPLFSYGNSVLEKYGRLTIPFFSRDEQYFLVLDRRQHRITLKVNPAHPKNTGITDGLRVGQPFDLAYSEVATFHQSASSMLPVMSLSENSAALDLGIQGLAPYYAMMPAIHCLYGESWERRATARLGAFLTHELGLPAARVKLVDPNGTTHDVLGGVITGLTMATMVAGQVGIQHEEQLVTSNKVVDPSLSFEQSQIQDVQSQGQDILQQQQDDAKDRKDTAGGQQDEAESMEQQLAEQGFDLALDMDVPGYIKVLTAMLRKDN